MSVPASAGAANGAVLPVKEIVVATPNVKTVIFGLGRDKRRIKQMSQTSNVSMQWREELNVPDVPGRMRSKAPSFSNGKCFEFDNPVATLDQHLNCLLTSHFITGKQEKVLEKRRWDRSVTTIKRVTASC